MSDGQLDVLIAGFSSPEAARRDYTELVRLHEVGAITQTKGIVLLTADADAKVSSQETGGGMMGKLVGRSVAKGFKGQLSPDSGTLVAVFDSDAKPGVDKAVSHHVRKAFAHVDGSDGKALEAAFTAAGDQLTGAFPTGSSVPRVDDLTGYSLPGRRITVNGVNMHVFDQGSGDKAVLMVHGMPDTSSCWKYQVPDLVAAGYRVIVPDLVGSGLSDKPEQLDHYVSTQVVADLAELLDQLGVDRVHLVGHGWGAQFCWEFAMAHPFRVGAMVVLSVGHPQGHMVDNLFSYSRTRWDWRQINQTHPKTAELYAAADCTFARMVMGTHPELEDVLTRNLSQPEGFGPTLRWDVANPMPDAWLQAMTDTTPLPDVHAPVLGIWPTGDVFCFEHQVKSSGQYVKGPFHYERVEAASHWASLDAPQEITRLILDWFGQHAATIAP